jgi:hypothetical protein
MANQTEHWKSRPPLSRVHLCLLAALLPVAGIALLILVRLPKAVVSLSWPATEGTVVSSELAETGFSTDEGWYPHVLYRYSVDGKDYVSDDVEVIGVANGSTDYYARRVIERYPVGAQVEVHYAPDSPAVALLESGMPNNDIFTSLLFLGGAAGGVLLLCVGLLCIWGIVVWKRWAQAITYRSESAA